MDVLKINSLPIATSIAPEPFKIKRLQMEVKDELLHITLQAPKLIQGNFLLQVEDGFLTLKVVVSSLVFRESKVMAKPVFQDFFLALPRADYNKIVQTRFEMGTLEIYISKALENNTMSHLALTGVA